MDFSSDNIKSKIFNTERKGFSKEEVKKFLSQIAEELEEVVRNNYELELEIGELKSKIEEYRSIEKELRDSIIFLNEEEKETITKVKAKAEEIIKEAEHKGEQIILNAEEEAKSTRDTLLFLKEQKEIFTARLKIIIDSQEGMLLDLKNNNSAEVKKSMAEAAAFKTQTEINIEKILEKLL